MHTTPLVYHEMAASERLLVGDNVADCRVSVDRTGSCYASSRSTTGYFSRSPLPRKG
jgi:hypothetical protein